MTSPLFVATLIAPQGAKLTSASIQTYTQRITDKGGHVQKTVWLKKNYAADVFYADDIAINANDLPFDVLIQKAEHRSKKVLIADMESTIIEQEMLDELANRIGIGEQVAEITRKAMNGEIDFTKALTDRVGLLKGQPESLLKELATKMTLSPGAQILVSSMKHAGCKTWLVSGGFTFFVKIIAERLGFDRFFANELIVEDGFVTGHVRLPILGKDTKKELLKKACQEFGIGLEACLAVGDGANDIPMLQTCVAGGGLGVAYRAKPKVREIIHSQINHGDLSALVYAQNFYTQQG
jgi:phosphoserine phosphatase